MNDCTTVLVLTSSTVSEERMKPHLMLDQTTQRVWISVWENRDQGFLCCLRMNFTNSFLATRGTYWSLTCAYSHLNSGLVHLEIYQQSVLFKACCLLLNISGTCTDLKKVINVFLLQILTASLYNLSHHCFYKADETDSSFLFFIIFLVMIVLEFVTLRRHRDIQLPGTLYLRL